MCVIYTSHAVNTHLSFHHCISSYDSSCPTPYITHSTLFHCNRRDKDDEPDQGYLAPIPPPAPQHGVEVYELPDSGTPSGESASFSVTVVPDDFCIR